MARKTKRTPKVSVIIPAYNVDRFIGRAIESLQNQTLRDFELLVVDDGSTDRTGQVADKLAERDIRIEVIHTKNQGAAAARNTALDRATGEFVHFVDADDWVEPEMLADLVAIAERDDLDLVIAGFYIETYYGDEGQYTSELKSRPTQTFASPQEFRACAWRLFDTNLLYTPWNKLFRRSYLERIHARFKPTFWDDFPFVLDVIRDIERVGVTERAYYHFIRFRQESETARWRPNMYEKREEEHGWMLDLYEHWGLAGDPASVEMIQRRLASTALDATHSSGPPLFVVPELWRRSHCCPKALKPLPLPSQAPASAWIWGRVCSSSGFERLAGEALPTRAV